MATVDSKAGSRYGVVVRFDKVNYAGVATNNYSLDELVPVGPPPPSKAKPVAKPAAAPKVADSANQAQAISKNENVNKFQTVNLFEPNQSPVYKYDSSGTVSIAMQENYWNTKLNQAAAAFTNFADTTLQWPKNITLQ